MQKIKLITERIFDITIASLLLIILAIPMLIVTSMIYFHFGRPILFCQKRTGLHGKAFTLYKFRTMHHFVDNQGQLLNDAQRIQPIGAILRQLSLDELPQLFNILKGDMRLVGPRPMLHEYLSLYTEKQIARHQVKPGMTGLAQIKGRNLISYKKKFNYDIWYAKHRNFCLDLKIILLTIKQLLNPQGINHPGSVSVEKFNGNN